MPTPGFRDESILPQSLLLESIGSLLSFRLYAATLAGLVGPALVSCVVLSLSYALANDAFV
jgi:hypothetical protein